MKRILFPVVQEVSAMLVPTVIKLATSLGAEVHVLHVAPPSDQFIESRIKVSSHWLDTFVEKYLKNIPVQKVQVILGDPAEEIINYSENQKMDLVVMGTHGRKGIDRFYFGNVAENVVARSSVPVLSINPYKTKEINVP